MDLAVIADNAAFMAVGLVVTVQLALIALCGGLLLGLLLAAGRLSRIVWFYYPASLYVHFMRGLPLILVIFWIYFLFPVLTGKKLDAFWAAAVSFIVYEASYFAEIIRAGIQSIPDGQAQAALSSGLTTWQSARYVILPQALRNMVPSLVTQAVIIFQDTSPGLRHRAARFFTARQPGRCTRGALGGTLPFCRAGLSDRLLGRHDF